MKRNFVTLLALAAALVVAAPVVAQTYDPAQFKSSKPESAWKIALVPKDATNAWFVRMEVGVKQFAKDTGINVFQKGPPKTDAAMQAQVIEDLIAQHVDAICVVPVDPAAIEPVLGEALSKGIVVITTRAPRSRIPFTTSRRSRTRASARPSCRNLPR